MQNIIKKIFIPLIFIALGFTTTAQTHLYENPNFEQIAKDHKVIAILPFKAKVSLRPKQMKEISAEQLAEMEKNEGYSIQSAMYSWFLKRKTRGKLLIDIQDPHKTNAILAKNDVDLSKLTSEEIAQLLEVDAIIGGDFETDKPMSEGASIALGLLVGFYGATNSATINMSIHNAKDGELLWNYNKRVVGSLGSNTDGLINTLMRKASRRLAYTS